MRAKTLFPLEGSQGGKTPIPRSFFKGTRMPFWTSESVKPFRRFLFWNGEILKEVPIYGESR